MAGEGLEFLEEKLPELTSIFEHDFTRDGLPDKYFQKLGPDGERFISARPDGIHVVRPGTEKWAQTALGQRFRIQGDFDITATFDQLQTHVPKTCTIQLLAILQEKANHRCRIARMHHESGRQYINANVTAIESDGARGGLNSNLTSEANSGRFRLARRGDKVYFLFAEGDSPVFSLLATETVSTDEIISNGIRLAAITNGTGSTSVVWKNLSVRAEKLLYTPRGDESKMRLLYVMNADGTNLRQLTKRIEGFDSQGSADWSPDGKKIAFDCYDPVASKMFIINSDGTDLKPLGLGNMPTFSADGKELVFSWGGRGITKMKSDATDRETVARSGWGSAWSPDGKSIAIGYGSNVAIWDIEKKEQRLILEGDHARRFGRIYWNMTWSPDNKQVCFKATNRTTGKYEIAIANVDGSSNGFLTLYESESDMTADFSWHPNGERILFSRISIVHPQPKNARPAPIASWSA